MKSTTPHLLCILDGFGLNPRREGNAIAMAQKPNFDRLWEHDPHTTLTTFGEAVGLTEGQMGNSEVGHLNIGAGRVVEQWLLRIGRALKGGGLASSPVYRKFLAAARTAPVVHLIGLFSDGGVHSHSDHAVQLARNLEVDLPGKIKLHIITDGRDTSPNRALDQISALERELQGSPRTSIATICGRFYAMDRDKRWERVEQAYRSIAEGIGNPAQSAAAWIARSYEQSVTDEFIEPAVIDRSPIGKDDAVVFWNFRADRMREIVRAVCLGSFSEFERRAALPDPDKVLCFTDYDSTYHLPYLFEQLEIANHLGEVVSKLGIKQLRTAETEKYPHVTYFLNGGIEAEYPGETRVLVPSPRDVKTYDLKPEMSAVGVTDAVVSAIESGQYGLIVVNLANCDMVGHTGVIPAAIKAAETVDACLGRMLAALDERKGVAVILADHGNADQMIDYDTGAPHTAHTLHPVPFIVHGAQASFTLRQSGALCDVAPTVLELMGISQPSEMTGRSLIQRQV